MKSKAPLTKETLEESLSHYRRLGFYADGPQGEISGLPDFFDGVVHELSHAVTLPGSIENSEDISSFFMDVPPELCDRLELAAWLVEWSTITLFKSRFPLRRAVKHCHMASKKRYQIDHLYEMALEWKEEDFVSEATDIVFAYLAYPDIEPKESVRLPAYIWEGE